VNDPDEPIDPLDPRFVDAVLARARQRAQPAPAPIDDLGATVAPVEVPPARNDSPSRPSPPPLFDRHVDEAPRAARAVVPEPIEPAPLPVDDVVGTPTVLDDDGDDDARRRTRNAVEWIAVAVGAVVVAFLIRAFLLQAFYIPSESMEPTLRKNDRILVNKLSYKLHDINRGDLVVFEKPPNERESDINDLIKRVIARPHETIELHTDGTITIDGLLLSEPYIASTADPGPMSMQRDLFVAGACTNPVSELTKCTIGDGFIWVMGDNRGHSHDSRMFGPIDDDLVVGRAFVKVWPLSKIGFL
jgi:signal peptidase I